LQDVPCLCGRIGSLHALRVTGVFACQVKVFFKETDEVRADLEMGGLGPGLTGEHTLYSYVVVREDTDEDEERCPKSWVITHRYSSFHIFDKILLQIIKEEGGDETWLAEVTFHCWPQVDAHAS
jgi:hypothetical protein